MVKLYVNTLKIEFGRPISDAQLNEQFELIEAALAGLEAIKGEQVPADEDIFDAGSTTEVTHELDAANGVLQSLTVVGTVTISFAVPTTIDPKVIHLMLIDGGSGKVDFAAGSAWTTDSMAAQEVKIHESDTTGGPAGAFITCIWDGTAWVYLAYGRNDIDFTAAVDVVDLYNWR